MSTAKYFNSPVISATEHFKVLVVYFVLNLCGFVTSTGPLSLKVNIYHRSPGNSVHRIGQSGVASSEREQITSKQRENARLNESTKSAKTEPRDHHQSHLCSELTCYICNRQFRASTGLICTNTHKLVHRIIKTNIEKVILSSVIFTTRRVLSCILF